MSGAVLLLIHVLVGVPDTHRRCEQNPVPLQDLQGKTPRETRAALSSVLGPPVVETNQLPDGGQFARLELADLQDGVTQRYTWGQGTLDVVFQGGHAQLVALRLDEYETYVRSAMVLPCDPLSREQWSKVIGINLPRKASTSKMGRGQSSLRYDQKPWMVRLRCQVADTRCTDASIYLPNERTPPPPPPVEAQPQPVAEAELKPLLEKPVRPPSVVQNARRRVLKGN
jgi:hypothetical protein